MKKIILLITFPFIIQAQQPTENKVNGTKDSIQYKNPLASERSQDQAKELIESYRQRVIKGESMSVLAGLYSEDPGSAKNGGEYDNMLRGQLVPEFENIAFSLKPKEISKVFKTEYGFHFIQLISRNGESLNLRHILVTYN